MHDPERRREGSWSVLSRLARRATDKRPAPGEIALTNLEPRTLCSTGPHPLDQPDIDFPAVYDDAAIQETLIANSSPGGILVPVSGGVPVYHSNPSAPAKIIIDFDGDGAYTWGSYNVPATPAYDQDGDATTFNTAELASINEILMRVSEKYSPFNIDVTNVDTGYTYVNKQSVHVVVGGTGSWLGSTAGGIAYIGGFYNFSENNAYVFPANLGNGYAKYVAEAVAHEAGHTFGLQHQSVWSGTTLQQEYNPGNTYTAPIMGNSYYAQRGLWWTGTPSNNSSGTQTDLSILSNTNNGFGFRNDDYGNSIAAASPATVSGNTFTMSGVIAQSTDLDYFSFSTGDGHVTLTLSVAQYGAMLDGSLFLYDSSGSLVASADTSAWGESLSLDLTAGTYYIAAASHGGYGDIGQYTLAGAIVPGEVTTVADPTGLTANAVSASRISLTWVDHATNESGFIVERSSDSITWSTVGTTGTNVTTYNDDAVAPGTKYYYRVKAYNADMESQYSGSASATTLTAAPTDITATPDSATQITLAWSDVTGETGYLIERSTNGSTWTQIASLGSNVTTYADTGRSAGTTYYYRIRATAAAGNSAYSTIASALTLPATPTNLTGSGTTAGQVTLSWTTVPSATSYSIERSPDGSTWSALGTSLSAAYTDTGLPLGTHFYYRVKATNASGSSAFTTTLDVLTPPAAPTLTSVTPVSATKITIAWASVPGATSYQLERSLNNSTWTSLGTTASPTYDDTTVAAGTRYYYRIRAVNSGGTSTPSGTANALTMPATPTTFTATVISGTQVNLSWSTATGATSYSLERSADAGATWSLLAASQAGTTYSDTSASAGVTYTYRVKAINTSGNSGPVSATALTWPGTPAGLAATVTANSATLTWTAVPGAASYSVERSTNGGTTWTAVGSPTAATFSNTGLAAGTAYSYRVRATNASGSSSYSTTTNALTLPAAPTLSQVTADSASQLTVQWTTVTGATSYLVERSTDNTTWTPAGTVQGTTYVDAGLTTGTRYYYRLRAANTSGPSAYSTSANAITLPATPTALTPSAVTATQVTLTWTPVTGATSYTIQRSTDGVTWSTLGTSASPSYPDTALTPNTRYLYRVRSANESGNSAYTTALDVVTATVAPTTTLATPIGKTKVTITWTAPAGATSYSLERSTDGTNWTLIATPQTTSFEDTAVSPGILYSYRISASNAGPGTSAYGTTATALTSPDTPPALDVTPTSTTTLTLSWTPATGATSYDVEQSEDGLTWFTIGNPTDTSLPAGSLTNGTTYYFRVRALNPTGASDYVIATNVLTPPTAPAALSVSTTTASSLTLTWSAVSGATLYTVERSADDLTWQSVGTTTTGITNWSDTGLAAGTHYSYRITASNPSGTSPASDILSTVTTPSAPAPNTSVSIPGRVRITWQPVTGATSYSVERSSGGAWTPAGTSSGTTFDDFTVAAGTTYSYRVSALNTGGTSNYSAPLDALTLPDTPSNLTLTPISATQVDVSWNAVTGATSYRVDRSLDGSIWSTVGTTPATTLTDLTAAPGTQYLYRVTALNASGPSTASSPSTILTLPAAPTTFSANPTGPTTVTLIWTPTTGADSYQLERSIAGTNTWTLITTLTTTSYSDDPLTSGVTYAYRVRAVNAAGASLNSLVAEATPPIVMTAPSNLTLSPPTSNGVTLSWTDNSDNEAGFRIERSADGGLTWLTAGTTAANITTFADNSLAGGTTYAYRVRAINGVFVSDPTDNAETLTRPAAPTGFTVVTASVTRLNLSWAATPGAGSYQIDRSDNGVDWETLETVTETSYADTGLLGGSKHYYRVRATNASGESPNSATVARSTFPAAPSYLAAMPMADGPVALAWAAVDGATAYLLERSTDGSQWAQLTTQSATLYTDTSTSPGTHYFYRARALGEDGASGYSPIPELTTYPAAPASPLALPLSSTEINISWTPMTGAAAYVIERLTEAGEWLNVATVSINSFTDAALEPNVKYSYRVRSLSDVGSSPATTIIEQTTLQSAPEAPSALTIEPISGNTLRLGWTRSSRNEVGFRVEYSKGSESWKLAGNVPAGLDSVQITGLITGDHYRFRVAAYNEMGLSPFSPVLSGKAVGAKMGTRPDRALDVQNVKPAIPGLAKTLRPDPATGLTARAYSTSAVQLTWTDNADNELGYRVEYSPDGRHWSLAGYIAPDQTGCRVTGLTRAKAYWFRVTAYNFAGEAPKAAVAKGTVPLRPPTGAKPSTDADQDTTLSVLRVKTVAPGLLGRAA